MRRPATVAPQRISPLVMSTRLLDESADIRLLESMIYQLCAERGISRPENTPAETGNKLINHQ
ncbi:hypothetical protein NV64_21605 [Erwinia sp. B116]|nr:hypothetical protein ASF13_21280 [Erwinia sp. Leaf53]PLV47015.1 hypothetical protein NV64_21605 [Erwinia sp. B116]